MCFVLMILEQFQYESAGVFRHNVYIYMYIKILVKSDSSLIVFALLQTKLCNGGLMSHTRM